MTSLEAKNIILETYNYTAQQSVGYQTWGKVDILQIAVRINQQEYAFSKDCKNLKSITENDIIISNDKTNLFGKLFHNKKKIEVILITKQTYAAQVKEEIPPILDDQAQLLGVSIRIAKNENNLSYKQSIDYIINTPGKKTIVLGFENSSRRYKENDISWIWDIDFEILNNKNISKILLSTTSMLPPNTNKILKRMLFYVENFE